MKEKEKKNGMTMEIIQGCAVGIVKHEESHREKIPSPDNQE